ncbi:MAG: inositol polyphosphate phosphatase [Amphiamblys sp. WSBS2006]|nr:MAG: inositol polyphosphate phosphatase [Amphiamblys sp. WSBS2006]
MEQCLSVYISEKKQTLEIRNNRENISLVFTRNEKNGITASLSQKPALPTANRKGSIYGLIGLIRIAETEFIVAVSKAEKLGEQLERNTIYRVKEVTLIPQPRGTNTESSIGKRKLNALTEYFAKGTFYYSHDTDLTLSFEQKNTEKTPAPNTEKKYTKIKERIFSIVGNRRYVWNKFLLRRILFFRESLLKGDRAVFDGGQFLVFLVQGHISVATLSRPQGNIVFGLISRVECKRTGTRCSSKGLDENGNVSGFVETETVVSTPTCLFSHVSVRGTIPIFWMNKTVGIANRAVATRSVEATQPCFDRHFDFLLAKYKRIHVLSLLSLEKKENEAFLTLRYKTHLKERTHSENIEATFFDISAESARQPAETMALSLAAELQNTIESFGYFLLDRTSGAVYPQRGVFRVNCFDSLDRTNIVQEIISRAAVQTLFLDDKTFPKDACQQIAQRMWRLWIKNGDDISKIHAGSKALKTQMTKQSDGGVQQSLRGLLSDMKNKAVRIYQNTFNERKLQNSIDVLLGRKKEDEYETRLDVPAIDAIQREIARDCSVFTSHIAVKIQCVTWNAGGLLPGHSMLSGLIPPCKKRPPTIVSVGLQEMVSLSPQNVLLGHVNSAIIWEEHLQTELERLYGPGEYILLSQLNMVGLGLFLFIQKEALHLVRDVEMATKKTGMSGMTGNKGAVSIRLTFSGTRLCFVAAHFAAGMELAADRNTDFHSIVNETFFTVSGGIHDHDLVIWAGDLNYRVDLEEKEIHSAVVRKDIGLLLRNDQLHCEQRRKKVFTGYREKKIAFMPTYKLHVGTSKYSQTRTPSWTDRILYRAKIPLSLREYSSVDLCLSDHLPVHALFSISIKNTDKKKRKALEESIYAGILEEATNAAHTGQALCPPQTWEGADETKPRG